MIFEIAAHEPLHIVTIEDPIEFLFTDKVAAISQREVGSRAIMLIWVTPSRRKLSEKPTKPVP